MSYLHLPNLYKNTTILAFRECYSSEKIHGSSSHIRWDGQQVHLSPGNVKISLFTALFDVEGLAPRFRSLGHEQTVINVYGEVYGGKEQGMSANYGFDLAFTAFDVKIGDSWLDVPNAEEVVKVLGLEFVPYEKGPTDLAWIDAQRDADSIISIRRGMGPGKKREGVVLRPLFEVRTNNDERIIAKHRRAEFQERATPMPVDFEKLAILSDADKIANEWVVEMRLVHVLQKIPEPHNMALTPVVIAAMVEDVLREAKGEIVDSRDVRRALSTKASKLYKARVLRESKAKSEEGPHPEEPDAG